MELFMETYVRSEDRKTKVQQFVNSWAQHFVVHWFSTIFFLKLLFSWIWWFHFLFQETYNSRLKEIYGDDPSTNPDFNLNLWLEAGLSSGPDRNRVYRLSNTTTENLQTVRGVSTIGSSQSVPSTQSLEFTTLYDQGVQEHMAHLNEKYEWLSADYEELHRMVIDIRLQMSHTCAPPY
jgi:hypothetical protein